MWFQRQRHLKTRWWLCHLGLPIDTVLPIFYLEVILLLQCVSTQIAQLFEMSKIGFQGGGYGSHFGFPICIILAIFHLHINLLLHCKFQLNSPCGLRDVQNRFSRRWLWWPSRISNQHDFSSLQSRSCPVAVFQLKSTKGLERDVKK